MLPAPGQLARVRQRLYLVEETVPSSQAGDSALVRMSCVDDDAQGQALQVLWEREIDPEVLTAEAWESLGSRGFDAPNLFAAYLNTLRWNCVTSTDPKLFQSPFRAGIRLDAYQLEPLRKALLLPRVNLFIADDVGLGKTIEAGLIARELLLRKKANEIVVCCPPSMLLQWRDELESRFGLTFEILDREYVQRVRRERGFGVNPWTTHSRFLVSHALWIDENYTNPLLDWLGDFRPGSLLILDEAHHAAPASGQRYAIDSQFTRAVRDVAKRFEHRLFLSATPHNGHANSFSALLEILDPQRFCRGVTVNPKAREAVMVRRLKEDLRVIQGGFPERVVEQIDLSGLPPDTPELQLSAMLNEYRRMREERLQGETKRKQAAAAILISGLQQRLLSSIEAFAGTLRVHRRTVKKQWEQARSQQATAAPTVTEGNLDLLAGSIGSDDERATLTEEDMQAEEAAQVAAATAATIGEVTDEQLFQREQQLLDQMAELADRARSQPDARVRKLIDWIREKMFVPGKPGEWNNRRILIFTEYGDTRRYLVDQLTRAFASTDRGGDRIAFYHGPSSLDEREAIKQAFNADPRKHPLRILVATDAAREGLNLQAHCADLFHFDVPWNPARLEQRNGRIDRKLQPQPQVYCRYFVYTQRPEDRILQTLVRKTETIKRELGSLAQVIDARLTETLKYGIRREVIDALQLEIDTADLDADQRSCVEEDLEAARERQDDLRRQIGRLQTILQGSREAVGLTLDQFRAAISSALELVHAQPLRVVQGDDAGPERFQFPALDQSDGADSTWADTLDALRPPRPRGQRPLEWRRQAPIRPVVFEDTGSLDDDVVQLHLEHRVVQRLLGRFTAQGFVYKDLSRACLAQSADAVPRVVLLGRLALYGPGAARLHEELVAVTARWTDPKIRTGALTPYARDAESKTLALLEDSLTTPGRSPTPQIQARLQESAPRDIQELLPHLQSRAHEYAQEAAELLKGRAEAEAKAMAEILQSQKSHIADAIARYDRDAPDLKQGRLGFVEREDELRQLRANHAYWVKRQDALDEELQREPERIRRSYDIQGQPRIEPVGLVYLWPVTG